MLSTTCAECARLWRLYSQTTNNHLTLMADQQDADKRGDLKQLRQLEADILQAGIERARARAAIENHEKAVHRAAAGRQF
jgi:hypothetical protein